MEAAEQGPRQPAATTKPAAAPKEKVGTGRDDAAANRARLLAEKLKSIQNMKANAEKASDPAARQRILNQLAKAEAAYKALKNSE
jgi:hypothetical protein